MDAELLIRTALTLSVLVLGGVSMSKRGALPERTARWFRRFQRGAVVFVILFGTFGLVAIATDDNVGVAIILGLILVPLYVWAINATWFDKQSRDS
jgi:hypothetical protein